MKLVKGEKCGFKQVLNPPVFDLNEEFVKITVKNLGKTEKDIVRNLKKRKVKGYRDDPSSCPLANYFSACGFDDIGVDGSDVTWDNEGEIIDFSLPLAYGSFVRNFDEGKYPELDLNPNA